MQREGNSMANGQQKAQQNVDSFICWSATMKDDDYRQIVYRGSLSRVEIAKAIGCAKSALLQNPKLRNLLEELENGLRQKSVLPNMTKKAEIAKTEVKQYDKTASKSLQDAKRVAALEQEVLHLKMRLDRFKELSEVMSELGLDES